MISHSVLLRVQEGYNRIRGGQPADYNPVEKTPLHVSRIENQVFIQDAIGGGDNGGAVAVAQDQMNQTVLLAVHRVDQRQAENHLQTQASISQVLQCCHTQFALVHRNQSRCHMTPARPLGNRTTNIANVRVVLPNAGLDSTAKLAAHPRTLVLLWHEHLHGLDDNKPAKDFAARERGAVKFKHCRRKAFWSVMSNLIDAGFAEHTAIDKIHQAHGATLSVSEICKKIAKDKPNGGHPNPSV